MKSYIQGFITGGVFVFAFMVLMGSKNQDIQRSIGKYQLQVNHLSGSHLLDTETGIVYDSVYDKSGSKWRKNPYIQF